MTKRAWRSRWRRASRAMDYRVSIVNWPACVWCWDYDLPRVQGARWTVASLLLDGAPIEAIP